MILEDDEIKEVAEEDLLDGNKFYVKHISSQEY